MACVHASHIWTFSPLAFAWALLSLSFFLFHLLFILSVCVSLDLCFGHIRQFLDILNPNNETLINKREKIM